MAEPDGQDALHPEEIDSLFKDLDAILAQTPGDAPGESAPLSLPDLPAEPGPESAAGLAAGGQRDGESAADAAQDNILNDPLWREMTLAQAESASALAEQVGKPDAPADGLAELEKLLAGEMTPAAAAPPPASDGMPSLAELIGQSAELSPAKEPESPAAELLPAMPATGLFAPAPAAFAFSPETQPRPEEEPLPDFALDDLAAPAFAGLPAAVAVAAARAAAPAAFPDDASDPVELLNSGNAWRARGALGRAAECYERALALDPKFVKASCNLAGVLFELGERRAAERHLREGLRLEPGNQVLKENLAGLRRAERRRRSW